MGHTAMELLGGGDEGTGPRRKECTLLRWRLGLLGQWIFSSVLPFEVAIYYD